jgi:gluconokinase
MMTRDRVVLDTNIIISGFLIPNSKSFRIVRQILSRSHIIMTVETIEELREVLFRAKFDRYFSRDERTALLDQILGSVEVVTVSEFIRASRDPKDDKILEAAVNGRARLVVTGDQDLLILNPFRGIAIETMDQYWGRIGGRNVVVVLMGTTGSGKTTVGQVLARELSWEFADADDFHSAANKEKMSKGVGLTDEDRAPWLESLRVRINEWIERGESAVLACSALKQAYRDTLSVGAEVKWVYLKGSYDEISARLAARTGHYAKADLLASQFAVLEEPKDALAVSVEQTPEAIAGEIRGKLGL